LGNWGRANDKKGISVATLCTTETFEERIGCATPFFPKKSLLFDKHGIACADEAQAG
jgi:hypothetical protein